MLIRRETPNDISAVAAVVTAAFAKPETAEPIETTLLGWLREDEGWIPELSFVATDGPGIVGHVVCTRGWIDSTPALGLGPLAVHPTHQSRGVGLALMHTVLGAADALGESIVALLGDPGYYSRFGFRPASSLGINAPDPVWGDYFQARPLAVYDGSPSGPFTYAEPFSRM